jgi:putative glutamine amidotransferase
MQRAARPRIGLTMGRGIDERPREPKDYVDYASAIEEAGGTVVYLDGRSRGREREIIRELQGVLLTGGWDIDLRHYPTPPDLNGHSAEELMTARNMSLDPERDRYEIPLTQEAAAADLPVLGICRGCQVLNVALGGQLVLDIPGELPDAEPHRAAPPPHPESAWHALRIEPDSLLASIFPPDRYGRANSRHHQAVVPDGAQPGRVAAVSPADGVIEAIEIPGRRWALGVQWHPEYRHDAELREAHRPLFVAFVDTCG